jgi:hypothetical protein
MTGQPKEDKSLIVSSSKDGEGQFMAWVKGAIQRMVDDGDGVCWWSCRGEVWEPGSLGVGDFSSSTLCSINLGDASAAQFQKAHNTKFRIVASRPLYKPSAVFLHLPFLSCFTQLLKLCSQKIRNWQPGRTICPDESFKQRLAKKFDLSVNLQTHEMLSKTNLF